VVLVGAKPRKVLEPSKPYCGGCWHRHLARRSAAIDAGHAETTLNQPCCRVYAIASGDRRLAAVWGKSIYEPR